MTHNRSFQRTMRVYKFLCANYALQNLAKQRLKISEFTDMNDPYELSGVELADPDIQGVLIPQLQAVGVLCFIETGIIPCFGAITAISTKACAWVLMLIQAW